MGRKDETAKAKKDKSNHEEIIPSIEDAISPAYHESGHAVMYFFFGQSGNFYNVDIIPNVDLGSLGILRAKQTGRWLAMNPPKNSHPGFHRFVTIRSMMIDLAGLSAEYMIVDPAINWLKAEWESPDWKNDQRLDLYWADAVAKKYHEDGKRYMGFFARIAKWTDEVIREPKMWRVLEILAANLIRCGRLDRDEAWDIMEKAFGASPDTVSPFIATRKWKRRFFPGGKIPWATQKPSSPS